MNFARRGRIRLIDMLFLIAMLSLAMASLRMTWIDLGHGWYLVHPGTVNISHVYSPYEVDYKYNRIIINIVPLLVIASLTLLGLNVARNFPVCAQLVRQPGLVLCLTIVIVASATPLGRSIPATFLELPDIRFYASGSILLAYIVFVAVCLTDSPISFAGVFAVGSSVVLVFVFSNSDRRCPGRRLESCTSQTTGRLANRSLEHSYFRSRPQRRDRGARDAGYS